MQTVLIFKDELGECISSSHYKTRDQEFVCLEGLMFVGIVRLRAKQKMLHLRWGR